ncbi:MAG TPA: Asp-tRNA(Asn)/Glu-tRNA(Gln) amidotransferase subunit GatC [Flavisolibacter sp.]
MLVDDALISKLSNLSMLHVPPEEKEEIRSDLQKMIGFVDKLKELDTSGIEAAVFLNAPAPRLRPDLPGEMLDRQAALGNAPLHDDTFILVPRVIKKPSA